MVQTIINVEKLFTLSEREYKSGVKSVKLTPSIVIASIKGRINGYTRRTAGFYLYSKDNGTCNRFWEIHYLDNVKQAYLGLKLLSKCPVVEEDTLCACFYAMSDEYNSTTRRYLKSLIMSGFTDAEKHRSKLLKDYGANDAYYVENLLRPSLDVNSDVKSYDDKQEAV